MATAPDTDLAAHLNTQLGAFTLGTNLFQGPPRPIDHDNVPAECIFVWVSGGPQALAFVNGGTGQEQRVPTVNVRYRSDRRDFENGQTVARAIRDAIHHAPTAAYIEFTVREADPLYIGQTDDGSHEWSLSVDMEHLQ